MVAAFSFTVGNAQQEIKSEVQSAKQLAAEATVAPVSSYMEENLSNCFLAPRKTIENGVSYARPAGTKWSWWSSSYLRTQMYIPAIGTVKWTNMSTDKTGAWTQQYQDSSYDLEADENGDCSYRMFKISNGYINPYGVPYYTVGETSYIYGQECKGYTPWAMNGDSIVQITNANGAGGYYYGFSDACVFGTFNRVLTVGDETVNVSTYRVRDFYAKPDYPLCIYGLEFSVVSYNTVEQFMPEGTKVPVYFIRTVDGVYGPEETTDTIAKMYITSDCFDPEIDVTSVAGKSFGHVSVANVQTDLFGNEYIEPVIVDDQFVISIEGFNQEGVDFGLYMIDVMATERDYYKNGGLFPTLFDYVDADGNTYDGYWQYNSGSSNPANARHYNAVIWLNAITDIVYLYDGFEEMTAPVEGGSIYAEIEEEDGTARYATIQFETTLPWISVWEDTEGEDNYYIEDLPEWLEVTGVNTDYYEDYNAILLEVTAEPLPTGVKGRQAEIRVVSERGADSGVITVTQGEVETAIKDVTVKDNNSKFNGARYNISGQKVNADYKGIVIKDGMKSIVR